jgi:hypothetical protein
MSVDPVTAALLPDTFTDKMSLNST